MDDVGVDGGVVGRGTGRAALDRIEAHRHGGSDNQQRDHPAEGLRTSGSSSLHALGLGAHWPNHNSQAAIATINPSATQMNSCSGRASERPDITMAMRAPIAATMPATPQRIQPGK